MLAEGNGVSPESVIGVGTALGTLVYLVITFFRHQKECAAESSSTLKHIADTHSSAIREMTERHTSAYEKLSSESTRRSEAVQNCLDENNRILGRACDTLDANERIVREYTEQMKQRSAT
jgi:hypothetical protein